MDFRKLFCAAGILLAVGLLPACEGNYREIIREVTRSPNSEAIALELDGSSEVPPVDTAATGSGTLTVELNTGGISGSATFTGLSSPFKAAHIHSGFAGSNGPIFVPLVQNPDNPNQLDIPPDTRLSEADLAILLAGGMYVNVHTTNFPAGEIRGQITPEWITVLSTELSGDVEVPPVATAGHGIGWVTIDTDSGELVANVRVANLTTADAAHIHQAFAGLNGEVIVPLVQDPTTPEQWQASVTLTPEQVAGFMAGGLYFNVHTPTSPGGEIRGQITPEGITVLSTELSGDVEVPPVATAGSGIGYVTIDTDSGELVANVRVVNLPTADAAHIHQAFAGLNGEVVVPLAPNGTTPELWEATTTLTPGQVSALEAGELYFNVHTPTNPAGELRGQIAPEGVVVVRTLLDGSQEVPPVETAATGIGYSTVDTDSGDIEANIRTFGLLGQTAAQINQAAEGENGPVIVPLTRPDANGTPELWTASATLTADQIEVYLADEAYFNVHTEAFPDGEIRGQITP